MPDRFQSGRMEAVVLALLAPQVAIWGFLAIPLSAALLPRPGRR